jgi:DNA polymerase
MTSDLEALVRQRQSCRLCTDRDPNQIRNGSTFDFEPQILSYWSQWLGHRQPKLLIVGQDFGTVEYFLKFRGRDDPGSRTNANLRELLVIAGMEVGVPPESDPAALVFLTNSILCLKSGSMNAPIKKSWVRNCSAHYLRPLIRFLQPPVIVGMGSGGWMAVREALDLSGVPDSISQAAGNRWRTALGQAVFAVGHCSGLGLVNRSWEKQVMDWSRIGKAVADATSASSQEK